MELTPRYDDDPAVRIETSLGDVSVPLLRQRTRFAKELAALDADQWAQPSRCEGWAVQDVVAHLVGTNQFWAISITAGLAGSPTRFLTTFDPVATPRQMVEAVRSRGPTETLDAFVESNDALAAAIADIDDAGWSILAEAPPGHVALRAVALHALWDAWVHERDVVLPLGLDAVEQPDEVVGCLQYVAALGPAFLATGGSTRQGVLQVEATDPDVAFVVEVGRSVVVRDGSGPPGTPVIAGRSVDLIEALSLRAPLGPTFAEQDRWLLGGLAEVFDAAG